MNDIKCPYCGCYQEVNHDDGQGYEEDVAHEHWCSDCEKNFVFFTSIMFYYDPRKADCLNGSNHRLEKSRTYPARYTKMRCRDCDFSRNPTEEEMEDILQSAK